MAQEWDKVLPHAVHCHQISLCPSLDLLAAVTGHNQLEVFRFSGQRAFGYKSSSPSGSIDKICWHPNGTTTSPIPFDFLFD